jgi:hypothetical protein
MEIDPMANEKITPFKEFIDSVNQAKPETFAAAVAAASTTGKRANAQAITEMRAHILKHYEGVTVQHSFVDANGSIFDCVPVEQQPGLRGKETTVPKAPDLPQPAEPHAAGAKDERQASHIESPLGPGKVDTLGNKMECPDGTIPMRRLTLEGMSRFESLQQFFQKSPLDKEVRPPQGASPNVAATHKWAHAFQNVNNIGGHSFINIWKPAIGANQIFSLSQHWYVGGSGAALQTAEVGLQVYPGLYGGPNPCFFIYWTADDYNKTGCYNLTCSNFVQTNKSWPIGGAIGPISTYGGQQWELEIAYYLTGGRWWLYVKGTAAANAIGYYPASQYGNGVMATHAAEIDYGGEVVGTTSWPPMGSGHLAAEGWQKACYQRQIYYYQTGGGSAWASLTPSTTSPQCYTVTVNNFASPWNETIFYGGPGGSNC